jgi:hypothetical protein
MAVTRANRNIEITFNDAGVIQRITFLKLGLFSHPSP